MTDDIRRLTNAHALLTMAYEGMSKNFREADHLAQDREVQILCLLRERDAMAKALLSSNELMTALLDNERDPKVKGLLMDQMTINSILVSKSGVGL
jgi:hypothetical protein